MKVGLIINPEKTGYFGRIRNLIQWLDDENHSVFVEKRNGLTNPGSARLVDRHELVEKSDMVAVFGGDGTLLDASHELVGHDVPILGVNTGGLGFLTETTIDDIQNTFNAIFREDYEVQSRMMLEASASDGNKQLFALNDMVLGRSRLGRVIEVGAQVDDSFVTSYVCDGMIISTPTGSTAYNLAANGPIVHSEVESVILNPICPHTLTNRPLIVPASSTIRLSIESEDECLLTADGQDKITGLNKNDEVRVWRTDNRITLISPGSRNFYHILRTKLHWSGRTSGDRSKKQTDSSAKD